MLSGRRIKHGLKVAQLEASAYQQEQQCHREGNDTVA
jgi:hypothetical protein